MHSGAGRAHSGPNPQQAAYAIARKPCFPLLSTRPAPREPQQAEHLDRLALIEDDVEVDGPRPKAQPAKVAPEPGLQRRRSGRETVVARQRGCVTDPLLGAEQWCDCSKRAGSEVASVAATAGFTCAAGRLHRAPTSTCFSAASSSSGGSGVSTSAAALKKGGWLVT